MIKIVSSFFILTILLSGCQDATPVHNNNEVQSEQQKHDLDKENLSKQDTIVLSQIHELNPVFCDMDGDKRTDTVQIVQNANNQKYGLKFIFGNGRIEYLGMGQAVLGQGFDDFNWIGVFNSVPKGGVYYNNVNADGDIITEDEVKAEDKIKLPNDGVFVHQLESCGGGIIYLRKGKFEWIQQE